MDSSANSLFLPLSLSPSPALTHTLSLSLTHRVIGQVHYQTARATQKLLQDYKGLQDIIAILGKWKNKYFYDINSDDY